jgi:purine-nucleoside phosphorylase
MEEILKKAYEASEYFKKKMISKPQMAIVLGSGRGSLVDKMNNAVEISYSDIPNFPLTMLKGTPAGLCLAICAENLYWL